MPPSGRATWGALLGLALRSTAIAYVINVRLLATAGATNLLVVTYLIPVSAMLLGTLLLDERIQPHDLASMGVIGLDLAAIDSLPLVRLRRAIGLCPAVPAWGRTSSMRREGRDRRDDPAPVPVRGDQRAG